MTETQRLVSVIRGMDFDMLADEIREQITWARNGDERFSRKYARFLIKVMQERLKDAK